MAGDSNPDQAEKAPRYRLSLREVLHRAELARARTRQLVEQQRAMATGAKGSPTS
ncbi:MAG TPA: hypothetical protein VF637_06870 [Sphingomicrobium sp.]